MPIFVASTILPKNGAVWPVLDAQFLRGGFRSVADIVERDAIDASKLVAGMIVYQVDTDELWQLGSDEITWSAATAMPKQHTHKSQDLGIQPSNLVWDEDRQKWDAKQDALGFTPYDAANPSGFTSNLGTVTSMLANAPLMSSGGDTPTLSIPAATSTDDGYLKATDWVLFNSKGAGAVGTVSGSGAIQVSGTTTAPIVSIVASTTSVPGTMSAADKAKLDAITGTNTGDQIIPTTLPASDVSPWAKAPSKPTYTASEVGAPAGSGTSTGTNTGDQLSVSGNAGTATILQTSRTINGVGFNGSANITINAVDSTSRIATSLIGAANGVAPLGADSKIASTYLPSYVDDVLEFADLASFPVTGESGKIYVAADSNKTYRWSGSVYVYITSGAVDSVAGRSGVVTLTKSDVGLANVDNTSDATKQASVILAADAKYAPIAHVGSGGTAHANVVAAGAAGFMTGADKTKLDGIATGATSYAHPTGDGNLHVPATSTTNSGKVLTAGATAGSLSWATPAAGSVTSVGGTGTVAGLTLSGSVTTTGNLTLGGTLAVAASNFASQTAATVLAAPLGAAGVPTFRALVASDIPTLNQSTTGSAASITGTVPVANGGTGATTAPLALAALGGTTVGINFFDLPNPSAITFPRMNADNTVSALDAATFRTAIGAGSGSGTVTNVTGSGAISVATGTTTPAITIAASTTSVPGTMSAADKTKLDGIAASANNYVHPTGDGNLHVPANGTTNNGKVLTASATAGTYTWATPATGTVGSVGGTGTVNGLTLTGTVTTSGNLTLGGSITSVATTGNFQMNSLGVGTAAAATAGDIRATGDVTAYYSDQRLKDVVGNIDNALQKVLSLNGVLYRGNALANSFGYTSDSLQSGLLAQEVEAVLPEVVVPAPFDIGQNDDGTEFSKSGENYKTVKYERIIPLLVEAIKAQQKLIDALTLRLGSTT